MTRAITDNQNKRREKDDGNPEGRDVDVKTASEAGKKKKFEEMTLRAMESWIIMTEKKSPNDDWYLTRHTLHCNRSP